MSEPSPAQSKRRAVGIAVGLGLVPIVFYCGLIPFWDRVDPFVLGLPFNLFWSLCGMVLTAVCLLLTRLLLPPKNPDEGNSS